jgi:hypothetical protein
MKRGKILFEKKGVVSQYLPWILIAVAILAIIMITILLLREQGTSLIDKISELIRGR